MLFRSARQEEGRRQFREFAMAANDAAEARAVEMSLETLVEDEYARSFYEAERAAHEEANTARAIANSRLLADAFYRAAQAQELERLSREAARQDAAEERELAARELHTSRTGSGGGARGARGAGPTDSGELGARAEAPSCAGAHSSGGAPPADAGGQSGQAGEALACAC